jgi:hypothetical protein
MEEYSADRVLDTRASGQLVFINLMAMSRGSKDDYVLIEGRVSSSLFDQLFLTVSLQVCFLMIHRP